MTLDEAIKHAEEVAKVKEREAKINRNHGGWAYDNEATKCSACAKEHRQLAEWLKDYKRLREQKLCNDCISRQATVDAFNAFADEVNQDTDIHEAIEIVLNLPSVTPAEKVGHWEWKQYDIAFPEIGNYHCSSCDAVGKNGDNYCPNCGAKMQEMKNNEIDN